MTTFDEREAAFEKKFALDAEMQFKAEARADHKIAAWAGEKLGKTAAQIDDYAKEVVRADMQESGAEDVIAKLAADLGHSATVEEIREAYAQFLKEAKAELAEG